MIKKNIILFCLLISFASFAQTIKTDVLVIGSNSGAYAAAIQSAKSGVKTLLIDGGKSESITLSVADTFMKAGIYADFLKRVDTLQKSSSSSPKTLSPAFTTQVFKGWMDTIKNLSVLTNTAIKKIELNGKRWEVKLAGREIKAAVVLDASENNLVSTKAGLTIDKSPLIKKSTIYSDNKYRTTATVEINIKGGLTLIPLDAFIVPSIETLVLVSPIGEKSNLQSGQAAGAIAAYCAYFDKTTKDLNVRKIQTELLGYKSVLFKFNDIDERDSSAISFQHIALSGILQAKEENGKILFMPNALVSSDELKQSLKEFYSRSQIWFSDNKTDIFTLENTLSLIKYLGSRGRELNNEVEKGWNKSLRLEGKFDLKKPVTRRELAILLDTYLQPYSVKVDIDGNIAR